MKSIWSILGCVLVALLLVQIQAYPVRYRRDTDSSCNNIYEDLCPGYKKNGWCTDAAYTHYMYQVCPVTCNFCKDSTSEEAAKPALNNTAVSVSSAIDNATSAETTANALMQKVTEETTAANSSLSQLNELHVTGNTKDISSVSRDSASTQDPSQTIVQAAADSQQTYYQAIQKDYEDRTRAFYAQYGIEIPTLSDKHESATQNNVIASGTAVVSPETAGATKNYQQASPFASPYAGQPVAASSQANLPAQPVAYQPAVPQTSDITLAQKAAQAQPYEFYNPQTDPEAYKTHPADPPPLPAAVTNLVPAPAGPFAAVANVKNATKEDEEEPTNETDTTGTASKHLEKSTELEWTGKKYQKGGVGKHYDQRKYHATMEDKQKEKTKELDGTKPGHTKNSELGAMPTVEDVDEEEEQKNSNGEINVIDATEKAQQPHKNVAPESLRAYPTSGYTSTDTSNSHDQVLYNLYDPKKDTKTKHKKKQKQKQKQKKKQKLEKNLKSKSVRKNKSSEVKKENKSSKVKKEKLNKMTKHKIEVESALADDDVDEISGSGSGSGSEEGGAGELDDALAADLDKLESLIMGTDLDDGDNDEKELLEFDDQTLTRYLSGNHKRDNIWFAKDKKHAGNNDPSFISTAQPMKKSSVAQLVTDEQETGDVSGSGAESGDSEAIDSTEESTEVEAPKAAAAAPVEAAPAAQTETGEASEPAKKSGEEDSEEEEEEEEEGEGEDEKEGSEEKEDNKQDPTKIAGKFLPNELLDKSKKTKKLNDEEEEDDGSADTKMNDNLFSVMLRQNFDDELTKAGSAKFQMLSGNVQKDLEKTVAGSAITDLKFSEATIEGNPPQKGKTKVTFKFDGEEKKLKEIIETGNINGLSVVKNSLESESD